MKKIKKFESFINNLQTNYYVVNSVNYYDEYGTSELELPLIVSIVLEDGSILIAEEDTGGELAFFQIDSQGNVEINEDKKVANVFLPLSELSKAIGRNGLNIKQASKLTGYKINVFADDVDVDDVLIDDFSDEIDGWIIDILKGIGCDTAKSVLSIGFDDLIRRTDLEEETVKEIVKVLETEFK